MKENHFNMIVPGLMAAALALAPTVGAQTTPPAATPTAAKAPEAAPMTGHHKEGAGKSKHHTDMKAECQAMMAKKQEMQDKQKDMDARLDALVADMNAAKSSKAQDALELPMAAVLNELVAQRKAMSTMMMEMQPAMMSHMAHHMDMGGAKGAMGCPMMKSDSAPAPKAEDKKPMM